MPRSTLTVLTCLVAALLEAAPSRAAARDSFTAM